MKLCHVTKRSGLLSLAQYRYSSDTCHMTQLRSFICLPQPPFWGIVFSSNAWPFAAIVVGSVSTISLAFCISCLESPRSLLKYCLNIINYKMPTKLKKRLKKISEDKKRKISAIISHKFAGLELSGKKKIYILKHLSLFLNVYQSRGLIKPKYASL